MAPWLRTMLVAAAAFVTGAVLASVLRKGKEESAPPPRPPAPAPAAEADARIERLREERDRLVRELETARAREKTAPAPGPSGAAGIEPASVVAERLAAAARSAMEKKDGAALLAALRELAAIVPEGRGPAMGLIAEATGEREGLVGDLAWGGFLSSPAVTDLMAWSLRNPAPEGFRELAAEALAELAPPETLVPLFREALKTEKDEDVARSMVEALTGFPSPEADVVLRGILADGKMPVPVRVRVATHYAAIGSLDALRAQAAALEGEPPALAAGVRTALAAAESTETGFLVTGFVDGSMGRRGLEVGDVILSYDGSPAEAGLNSAIRGALGRDGTVKIEIVRSGARETLEVAPGWLGLIGIVVHGKR